MAGLLTWEEAGKLFIRTTSLILTELLSLFQNPKSKAHGPGSIDRLKSTRGLERTPVIRIFSFFLNYFLSHYVKTVYFLLLGEVFENLINIGLPPPTTVLHLGKSKMTQREGLRRKAQLCGSQNKIGKWQFEPLSLVYLLNKEWKHEMFII